MIQFGKWKVEYETGFLMQVNIGSWIMIFVFSSSWGVRSSEDCLDATDIGHWSFIVEVTNKLTFGRSFMASQWKGHCIIGDCIYLGLYASDLLYEYLSDIARRRPLD